MELAELIGLRPVPGAGVLLTLTRRCPLSCAHCSTSSTMDGEQPQARDLLRFVGSFTPADRPEVLMLTGGEPLLLPRLAARLAVLARSAGTRTALLSGMFFARGGRVPATILRAVRAVDHFSASLDVHHEREVPRADVLRAVREIRDAGVPVSFHLTGTGPDDPYLADVTAHIRREFADRVPMLVNEVRAVGRAAAWAERAHRPVDPERAVPCPMAAWPVVAFDGAVLACCNQQTVDSRPAPAHLLLGHAAEDGWPVVRRRLRTSPVLRMIRTVGPAHLHAHYAAPAPDAPHVPGAAYVPDAPGTACGQADYCGTCRALAGNAEVLAGAERDASGPVGTLLEQEAVRMQVEAGPVDLVRRHGSPAFADLVALGSTG